MQMRWLPSFAVAALAVLAPSLAGAQTEIDFFFPVPVDGKLAKEMTRLTKVYNDSQKEVAVTAVYTGSYDETKLKAQAATAAGKPPAVVLMSANFVLDLKIAGDLISLEPMLKADATTREKFLGDFWPALHANAIVDGELYAVPYQNSTPLLYYNKEHFKEAGLDPEKPPQTWAQLVDAAKKLTKPDRYGFAMPEGYDYLGWLMEALSMSNGGRYFNEEYGGEVYYDTPSMLGAAQFVEDLVFKHKVMQQGVVDAALDRQPLLCARQHEDALRRGVRAEERAQRRADRRRLAGHVQGPQRRAEGGRLEVRQVAVLDRKSRGLEPLHGLLLAAQIGVRYGRDEGLHGQEPGRQGGSRPATLRQAVVRDLPDRGRAQGPGRRNPGGVERQEEGAAGGQGRPARGRRADEALRRPDSDEAAVSTG